MDYTFIYYLHLFTCLHNMYNTIILYIFIDLGLYTNLLYFIIYCTRHLDVILTFKIIVLIILTYFYVYLFTCLFLMSIYCVCIMF